MIRAWWRFWDWMDDIGLWSAYVFVAFLLAVVIPIMFLTGACGSS